MKTTNELELKVRRVNQNNQEYLLGIFKISDILNFTRYTEYLITDFDENNNNIPITNRKVQRKLNSSKVRSIAKFLIGDDQAIFPTNIVVSIPKHVIKSYSEKSRDDIQIVIDSLVRDEIYKIDSGEKGDVYLSIIDGQHRVRGIELAIEELKKIANQQKVLFPELNLSIDEAKNKLEALENFEMAVTFFIDPVLEYQAMIFSTINRTQTKVSQDLVYSLFGLTDEDSPQKTALSIINVLNGNESSPFYKRIRMAGASSDAAKNFYKEGYPVLSQATMVKSILYMISKNSNQSDVERTKKRKYFAKYPDLSLVFRQYYADNSDNRMIKIIYTFFSAVRKVFVDENGDSFWAFKDGSSLKPSNIIQTTIGFQALLDILKRILAEIENEEDKFAVSFYEHYLNQAKELDFKNQKIFPFSTKGRNILYLSLSLRMWNSTDPNSIDDRQLRLNELLNED
jgi:DGQHR domain-containing protein